MGFYHMSLLLAFGAALVAGTINALAYGGSLISFPTLIWIGVPSIPANATNTIALVPGSMASVWGYRRELRGADPRVFALVVPSVLGGVIGALLLYRTPIEVFDRLVPALIFFATLLFAIQASLQRRFNLTAMHEARSHWLSWTMFFQLLVGIYGGYFGAGIGILMLAAFSLMGHTNIHQMNALKNVLAVCINAVASAYFVWVGIVIWTYALTMTAGAILGGMAGTELAQRIGPTAVRRVIVGFGFTTAFILMLRL
jgi:uncharacterized membrane protein YfcA